MELITVCLELKKSEYIPLETKKNDYAPSFNAYSGTKPCGICLDRHRYRFENPQQDPYKHVPVVQAATPVATTPVVTTHFVTTPVATTPVEQTATIPQASSYISSTPVREVKYDIITLELTLFIGCKPCRCQRGN